LDIKGRRFMELPWASEDIQGEMDRFGLHWKRFWSVDEGMWLSMGWDG